MEALAANYQTKPGGQNTNVDLNFCGCLGYCEQAPAVLVDDTILIPNATTDTVAKNVETKQGLDIRKMSLDELTKDDFLGDAF